MDVFGWPCKSVRDMFRLYEEMSLVVVHRNMERFLCGWDPANECNLSHPAVESVHVLIRVDRQGWVLLFRWVSYISIV